MSKYQVQGTVSVCEKKATLHAKNKNTTRSYWSTGWKGTPTWKASNSTSSEVSRKQQQTAKPMALSGHSAKLKGQSHAYLKAQYASFVRNKGKSYLGSRILAKQAEYGQLSRHSLATACWRAQQYIVIGVVDCVEDLCLNRVEVSEVRVECLQLWIIHGCFGQRLQVQQICVRRMPLGQNQMLHSQWKTKQNLDT